MPRSGRGTHIITRQFLKDLSQHAKSVILRDLRGSATRGNGSSTRTANRNGPKRKSDRLIGTGVSANVRKIKKPPRVKHGKVSSIMKRGVQFTREYGDVSETVNAAMYLGHATVATRLLRLYGWCAIVKELMLKAGLTVQNVAQPIDYLQDDDQIAITYQLSPNEAITADNVALSGLPKTIMGIADWLNNTARDYNGLFYEDLQNVVFGKLILRPSTNTTSDPPAIFLGANHAEINFAHSKIDFYTKSEFKMQNRSVAEVGDDEVTRVDNVPLYINIYQGKGNGCNLQNRSTGTQIKLLSHAVDGFIQSASNDMTAEPPKPEEFSAKRYKKKIFEPGFVEQSNMTFMKTIPFYRFFRMVGTDDDNQYYQQTGLGKYRVFGLDKVIETLGPETRQPIKVAWEHNQYYAVRFYNGWNTISTQLYTFNGTPGE